MYPFFRHGEQTYILCQLRIATIAYNVLINLKLISPFYRNLKAILARTRTFSDFSMRKMRATTLLVKNASRLLAELRTAFWLNQKDSDTRSMGTVSVKSFECDRFEVFICMCILNSKSLFIMYVLAAKVCKKENFLRIPNTTKNGMQNGQSSDYLLSLPRQIDLPIFSVARNNFIFVMTLSTSYISNTKDGQSVQEL